MSQDEITRREALRLARFGALLGTGLCVAAKAVGEEAQGTVLQKQTPTQPGTSTVKLPSDPAALTVKFYIPSGKEQLLVKTVEVPRAITVKMLQDLEHTAVSVKFWKLEPVIGGKVYFSWSETMKKFKRP